MTYRDVARLLTALAGLLLMGWVAGLVVTGVDFFTTSIDRPAIDWLADHRTPFWNSLMKAVTTLGGGLVITIGATLAATLAYLLTRDVRWMGFFLFASVGATAIDRILKPLVGRDRPDFDRLVEIGGRSFPSGHATAITALWLAIAAFVHWRSRGKARWVWVVAGTVIAAVLLSRPYLGVHYPSDVVAGAILSTAWVLFCARGTDVFGAPPRNRGDILRA